MTSEFWDGTGVTAKALADEVKRLGFEYPDRYAACAYTIDNEPECIIGVAVTNLTGMLVPNDFGMLVHCPEEWSYRLGCDDQSSDFRWLEAVQSTQDSGETWGNAISVSVY